MKKRIFKLLLVVLAVSLFATLLLSACQHSEVYYLSKGSSFTVYQKETDVPQDARLSKGANNVYTYTADFEKGEQFVIYNVGSKSSAISSVFSSEQHLTLADGKVSVADAGRYALSLDVAKGELTYTYTAAKSVQSVAITSKVSSLAVGESYKFVATVTMSDGSFSSDVAWKSSDESVATIDADGTAHAIAAGSATISATAGDASDSVALTVSESGSSDQPEARIVTITSKVSSLIEGATFKFAAEVKMSDGSVGNDVAWRSSNARVATIDEDGTVHALAAGITIITASADNDVCDSMQLTVAEAAPSEVPVKSITLSGDELEDGEIYMIIGDDPVTINVAVAPENATDKSYSYQLEGDEGVVGVTALQDGTGYSVSALKVGEVKLIVSSVSDPQVKAECTICVDPIAVTDLQISPASIGGESKFYVDDEQNITVTVLPENATDKAYGYELSKENIVSVEENEGGYKIKALAVGDVTLTITSEDNEAAVATCEIIVSAKVVESIEMESEITVEVGESHQLVATLKPDGVEDDNLLWEVKPADIVEVDNGNVTALAPGEATVTVQSSNGVTASCKVIVPKHLTAWSIPSALTIYTGEGAQPRDIEVSYTPSDATFKDFEVKVEQTEEFISYVKGEGKVTVTGLKAGTATLTITSADEKAEVEAISCTITVKDVSEAVPYVSKDEVTVDIQSSETIQVLSDSGEITNVTITNSYSSVVTATAKKGDDGVWNVTITGVKFGSASITVKATVAGKVTSITVKVTVAADYFYLTGNFDSLNWPMQNTEDEARNANVLMTKTSDTTWEITREFKVNDKLYVLPANIDTNWDNALRAGSFYTTAGGSGSTYIGTDADNAQAKYSGNYTVKLTLSTSGAKWTVIVNYLDVTSASLTSDVPSLTYGDEDQNIALTLTIQPSNAQSFITSKGTVTYEVEEQYKDWFTVIPGTSKYKCTLALTKFVGEEEVKVKITATIVIGEYTKTAEYTLTVMPQGAEETPVTEVNFDQEGPIYVNVSSGWEYTVHATVNDDATVQGVTYSLVSGGSTIYNAQSGDKCFIIDPDSGKITAKQFGLIKVRATSAGKNAEGKAVTKDIEILFYSNTLMITGSYYGHDAESWDSNTLKYTSMSDAYVYTWTNVELHKGDKLVFLYSTSDWDRGVMRVAQYHGTDNPGGSVTAPTTYDQNASFTVSQNGIYTINLDINRVEPKASFVKTGDVEVEETWSYTIGLYLNYYDGSTFHEGIATALSQKIDKNNPTVSLVCNFSTVTSTSGSANFGWAYTVDNSGKKYLDDKTMNLTYTGSVTKTWSSSAGWYWWHESSSKGNDQLQYLGTLKNTTWTFTFTFDDTGAPTTCKITSGNVAAASLPQSQSTLVSGIAQRQTAMLVAPAFAFGTNGKANLF